MIILSCSSKGGCGKSTMAVNFAAALAQHKKDVIIVDCDPIKTSSNWLAARKHDPSLPEIECLEKSGSQKLIGVLKELDTRYQYVVVDVPGADSELMRMSLTVAHKALIPFRPSQADMDELPRMQEMVEDLKEINPTISVYFFINAAKPGTENTEIREARQYFKNFSVVPAETIIYDRKAYRECLARGHGVVDNSKLDRLAYKEITNLSKEIGLW